MNYLKYLTAAGVPAELHAQAVESLQDAARRAEGLTLAKWKVRLFDAGKIAKALPWDAERLIDVRPDWADKDVAPMINITAHGDNAPWVETPEGGRPMPGQWLDTDPDSAEYKDAVDANYWCEDAHPRSTKSHKVQYRRNGGEFRAWRMGMPVVPGNPFQIWRGEGVIVYEHSGAWLVVARKKLIGRLHWCTRVGFEVDNVFTETGVQAWYPIDGYELRAPVTTSSMPKVVK